MINRYAPLASRIAAPFISRFAVGWLIALAGCTASSDPEAAASKQEEVPISPSAPQSSPAPNDAGSEAAAPDASGSSSSPVAVAAVTCTAHLTPTLGSIQSALDALPAGGTLCLAAGTYDVSNMLILASEKSLASFEGAVIAYDTEFALQIANAASNVTIAGITFQGGGILISDSQPASTIQIVGNTFTNLVKGDAITCHPGMSSSLIANNIMTNVAKEGSECIGLSSPTETRISGNTLHNCYEGMHINFYGKSRNVMVDHNAITQAHRHGIEIQNTGDLAGLDVSFNTVKDWTWLTPNDPSNDGHMALSIAVGGDNTGKDRWNPGQNSAVHDNRLYGTGDDIAAHSMTWNFSAIEFYGLGSVTNNYMCQWGAGVIYDQNTTDCEHTAPWTFAGNTLDGVAYMAAWEGDWLDASAPVPAWYTNNSPQMSGNTQQSGECPAE